MEKQSNPTQDAKRRIAQILVNAGLLGVGTGMTYAGARELNNILSYKHRPVFDAGSQLYDPIRAVRTSASPHETLDATEKVADVFSQIAKRMPDWFAPITDPKNVHKNWSVLGLGLPLAAGGMYAGTAGVNALLDAYKNNKKQQELQQTEREYHNAIKKQFEAVMLDKTALDAAYDNYASGQEKSAQGGGYAQGRFLPTLLPAAGNAIATGTQTALEGIGKGIGQVGGALGKSEWANQYIIGPYIAALGLTLGTGAYLGNAYGRKRQQDKIMERAILERRRARGLLQPLYAVSGSSDDEQ
jgi:hypothetical protein